MPFRAITRDVSPSINDCELSFHRRQRIDVPKAIAQHEAYRDCLAELGARIVSLPAEPGLPDAVFVEDAAVVLDEIAVIANMGAASRRPEAASVGDALARYRPLKFLTAPATLDGGDVLRIGRSLFVGLSRRTNRQGVEQLSELVRPHGYKVHPVEVTGCLHLKSACCYVGNNTILVNRSWIDVEPLRGFELLDVSEDEPAAANALLLNDVVVLPKSFPQTRAQLEERGFRVRTVDVSELQKAEAGMTCCSVILRAGGIRDAGCRIRDAESKIGDARAVKQEFRGNRALIRALPSPIGAARRAAATERKRNGVSQTPGRIFRRGRRKRHARARALPGIGREDFAKCAKSCLTGLTDAICCCPAETRTPGFPECSSLRAHGRAGFISQLIGSDFVVYRRQIRLRPAAAGLRRDRENGDL